MKQVAQQDVMLDFEPEDEEIETSNMVQEEELTPPEERMDAEDPEQWLEWAMSQRANDESGREVKVLQQRRPSVLEENPLQNARESHGFRTDSDDDEYDQLFMAVLSQESQGAWHRPGQCEDVEMS